VVADEGVVRLGRLTHVAPVLSAGKHAATVRRTLPARITLNG
jgi:hypothetical protein